MTDLEAKLRAALADRYRVDREIGRGGMAHVFLAHDLKLDRPVALKVLKPDLAAVLGGERFLREIALAARLEHPHVLGIHDSGEADGVLYYVMPYVEGESLRQRLEREKQLPLDDALQISREVADALSYAHSRGVIHRDIKPENILLEAGHAVVADFGIARAIDAAGGERLTETGVTLGTPSYMSPEQAGGSREIDGRSDLYSLGCVLYEMLAGQPPFQGPTIESVVAQHLTAQPSAVTNIRPAVPAEVEAALARALAKTPADRFNPVALFGEAIRSASHAGAPTAQPLAHPHRGFRHGLVAGLVVVVLAAVALLLVRPWGGGTPTQDRVVVAPFENRTGDADLDALGQMSAEVLAHGIAEAGFANVVAPSTVSELAPTIEAPAGGIGRALAEATNATTLVTGSYYLEGDNVRIQAAISHASDGSLLAALDPVVGSADRPDSVISSLREHLLGALAVVLNTRLDPGGASKPPLYSAYREFILGLDLHTRGDYRSALAHLYRAASLDTTFMAPIFQAMASHYNLQERAEQDSLLAVLDERREYMNPYEALRLDENLAAQQGDAAGAIRAVRRQAELAPSSGRTLYSLAVRLRATNRPREAVQVFRRADPEQGRLKGFVPYWFQLCNALHMIGEHEEELEVAERANTLFPQNVTAASSKGTALVALGRTAEVDSVLRLVSTWPGYAIRTPGMVLRFVAEELHAHGHPQQAAAMYERAVTWYQGLPPAEAATRRTRYQLGLTLMSAERWQEAQGVLGSLCEEFPDNVDYLGAWGAVAAHLGDREEAMSASEELEALDLPRRIIFTAVERGIGRASLWRARIAAALGERDSAVALLREAFAQGEPHEVTFHRDIHFKSVWDYEPFKELLRPQG